MASEVEKWLVTGMGAVLLTRDKIEEVVRRHIQESHLSREEAERLVEDLCHSGENQWSGLKDLFRGVIDDARSALNIGSQQTMQTLIARVDQLEKRVAVVEGLCRRANDRDGGGNTESVNPS